MFHDLVYLVPCSIIIILSVINNSASGVLIGLITYSILHLWSSTRQYKQMPLFQSAIKKMMNRYQKSIQRICTHRNESCKFTKVIGGSRQHSNKSAKCRRNPIYTHEINKLPHPVSASCRRHCLNRLFSDNGKPPKKLSDTSNNSSNIALTSVNHQV